MVMVIRDRPANCAGIFVFASFVPTVFAVIAVKAVRVAVGQGVSGLVDLAASSATGNTKRTNQSLDIAHQTSESSNWSRSAMLESS